MLEHATMNYGGGNFEGVDLTIPSPGSPPGMSSSKSSKASSLHSFNSDDDNSVLADVGHFEEIGLDDDVASANASHARDLQMKSGANPYGASRSDSRAPSATRHSKPNMHARDLAARPKPQPQQRDITSRPPFPGLRTHFRDTSTQGLTMGVGPQPQSAPLSMKTLSVRSASSLSVTRQRRRSPSPNQPIARSLSPSKPQVTNGHPRRGSSLSQRERKPAEDLERECDEEDDEDYLPEGIVLDNVPLSPRPPSERSTSRPSSTSASPERSPKERVRSVGNGTPPVAVASGSLRSPTWKSEAAGSAQESRPASPLKGRAKSWTAAQSGLSAEAKALTEKLEEYADEMDRNGTPHTYERPGTKPRVKSALAELPPLRRTNIMIDPLPVSKEKEAVLSRTRPSWLPPKDPAEEKKHLREYKKMVASSIEADKRREASRLTRERGKDKSANVLMEVWEETVLKRWDDAMRERRTRELFWKGVAPRCRGAVWARSIGNELGLSETSFEAALSRAREVEARTEEGKATIEDERRMAWFKQIREDVESQTWVDLKLFQSGGPLNGPLVDVLRAYSVYRSDIGYVSGCNAIAALLLLNLSSPAGAFIALANVLNRSVPLSFYACDQGAKASAYNLVLQTLSHKSARLHQHLTSSALGLEPNAYLCDMFTTFFTKHLSLDECTRLWDVYIFEGDAVLIRAAVALLLEREVAILGANTAEEIQLAIKGRSRAIDNGEDDWMVQVRSAGKS